MESPIGTPPNAPRKPIKPYSLKSPSLWRLCADSGLVRRKFLRYNIDDIEEIDYVETLERLYNFYNLPSSQTQNLIEEFYVCLMGTRILKRILKLREE